jgi:hypothetical protein
MVQVAEQEVFQLRFPNLEDLQNVSVDEKFNLNSQTHRFEFLQSSAWRSIDYFLSHPNTPIQNSNIVVVIHPATIKAMVMAPVFPYSKDAADGILFVSAPPKYQLPILVNFPSASSRAPFGPTLLALLRKAPNQEYRSM